MKKLIFILLDGLSNKQSGVMGYMQALVNCKIAKKGRVSSEMPPLSRPLYETLLTGKTPVEHGVVNNKICRLSKEESIFSLCKKNNLKTGASAYYWVSELYNIAPFDKVRDTFTENKNLNIQYGHFYTLDHYPDENVFLSGEYIRRKWDPDFLMIHPMNIDDEGHKFGVDSSEYRNAIRNVDSIMSNYIPQWIEEGYTIIVTSDHGMSYDGNHSGIAEEEAFVPLWLINDKSGIELSDSIPQIEVNKMMRKILDIK